MSNSKKVSNVAFIVSGLGNVTVFVNGQSYNITTDHRNYDKVIAALKNKEFDKIPALIDVVTAIITFSNGNLAVVDGEVYYKDMLVKNALTDRIVQFIEKKLPFEPLLNFFENLMLNPSKRAIGELFTFMEQNNLPITEDGHFLAYKRVGDDWMDLYTHKIDNSIGKMPKMNRDAVDDNKNFTCSHGLHFCSKEYLVTYGTNSGRIIVVKINPKDVVSIPVDYNNSKGRCCLYEVLYEIRKSVGEGPELSAFPDKDIANAEYHEFESPVYSPVGRSVTSEEDSDPEGYEDYGYDIDEKPLRDAKGHFVKGSKIPRDAFGRFV